MAASQYSSANWPLMAWLQFGLSSALAVALAFKKNGWTWFTIRSSEVPEYPQLFMARVMNLEIGISNHSLMVGILPSKCIEFTVMFFSSLNWQLYRLYFRRLRFWDSILAIGGWCWRPQVRAYNYLFNFRRFKLLFLSHFQTGLQLLSISVDVFAPYGEGFSGTDAPSGAILGSSGGNGLCGAAGATSSKKSTSYSACVSSTKESQSLISLSEIGAPKGRGSSLVLSGMISCSGTGTDLLFSWMCCSLRWRCLPVYYFSPNVLANQDKHQQKVEVYILIDLRDHILLQHTNPG